MFSISTSPGGRGTIFEGLSIPTRMFNALSLPPGDHGTARIQSIRPASNLSDSRILLTFAERVLIAVPCSVTTTASDDEFTMPTNTPGWNRGSHFPPLSGLAGMYKIFSPNSRMGVLSLRPCSLCRGVFPSLPMSHLFIRYAATSTSQHNILASGGILATSPTARTMIPVDWLSPTGEGGERVSLERSGFPLDGLVPISLANASIAGSLSHLSVSSKLVDEPRFSLCNPGKFCPFSRNHHRPRHLVPAFTDD